MEGTGEAIGVCWTGGRGCETKVADFRDAMQVLAELTF
jgi:hypothetical protein